MPRRDPRRRQSRALIFFRAAPAGHGVHRSFFTRGRFTRRREGAEGYDLCARPGSDPTPILLRASAAPRESSPLFPAGHGVLRSILTTAVGVAPCGRPAPAPVTRQQGAHAGAPLQSAGRRWAWVHRSEIGSRKSEAGRPRHPPVPPSRGSALLFSGFCLLSSGLFAGHGVHPSLSSLGHVVQRCTSPHPVASRRRPPYCAPGRAARPIMG